MPQLSLAEVFTQGSSASNTPNIQSCTISRMHIRPSAILWGCIQTLCWLPSCRWPVHMTLIVVITHNYVVRIVGNGRFCGYEAHNMSITTKSVVSSDSRDTTQSPVCSILLKTPGLNATGSFIPPLSCIFSSLRLPNHRQWAYLVDPVLLYPGLWASYAINVLPQTQHWRSFSGS